MADDEPTVEEPTTDGDVIRAFPVESLRQSIDRALATLPEGKSVAVIAYANTDGARLGAFARLGNDWSFMGVLEKPWRGELRAEAVIAWSK